MDDHHIVTGIIELIRTAETTLPTDVITALQKVQHHETGIAKLQLTTILENIHLAKETNRPLCQDTGIQTFFIDVGADFPHINKIHTWIHHAVTQAITAVPLRPNAVDPLTRKNGDDAIPYPVLSWNLVSGDTLRIHALPKGSGSENTSRLAMLTPSDGIGGITKTVLDTVTRAAGRPCPPTVVGVGIGGDAATALKLGKTALLRPVGSRHSDPAIARLEHDLISECNKTGIGPMGLGGKTTVLDVHIQTMPCHPAGLPVGVAMQCWADRRAQLTVQADGTWEVR